MIFFEYRWQMPSAEEESFRKDWAVLTELARETCGLTRATLYKSERGDLVALTEWPSREAWQVWRDVLADHPLREKYRPYRTFGPDALTLLVFVSDTCRA